MYKKLLMFIILIFVFFSIKENYANISYHCDGKEQQSECCYDSGCKWTSDGCKECGTDLSYRNICPIGSSNSQCDR